MRSRLSRLMWKSGITPAMVRRTAKRSRFALVMHGVSAELDLSLPCEVQPHHTGTEMEQTLAWLKVEFDFLAPQAFLETDDPGVLLTFDDGFANNYEVLLPILEAFNAPAIFFVTTQHVLDSNNWLPATHKIAKRHWAIANDIPDATAHAFFDGMTVEQLQECARHPLITIGSHTLTHPFLTKCPPDQQTEEISGSKQLIEELCGKSVDLFAYPSGDYDERVLKQVEQAGYIAAFAVDSLRINPYRFEIPRVGLYQSDESYLALKLSGLHRRSIRGRILTG